jgi:CheY-like chemotaxis protein
MSYANAVSKRPPKALIVDDDPAVVQFLRKRCEAMGLEVQEASNGLQALVMVKRERPDILIIDVRIPELDGLSLCSTLLQPDRGSIDVIVVSGSSELETQEQCQSFGATYAFKGPELWSTVNAAIKRIFPGIEVDIEAPDAINLPKLRTRPLVLVIDDDADVCEFLASRLRKCGADVALAADGRQGYRMAVREKPTLIISDYFMAEANINFLLWRLRNTPSTENIPVFAMTGYELDAQAERALINDPSGRRFVDQIFRKPLDIDALFTAIQKHCALQYTPIAARAIERG